MAIELNGWDVQEMTEAVEGVSAAPETGNLSWKSRVAWDGGFGLDVRTLGIGQMGEVMTRPSPCVAIIRPSCWAATPGRRRSRRSWRRWALA